VYYTSEDHPKVFLMNITHKCKKSCKYEANV